MATVAEVNNAFRKKKMSIQLPYPEDWLVKDLQILDKRDSARGVKVLLAVELIREGKTIQDLCFLEGDIDRDEIRGPVQVDSPEKRSHILPVRNRFDFDSEAEVASYLRESFVSLLLDNEYRIEEHPEADLYGSLGPRGFFVMCALRCDEQASGKARQLIELRKKHKHMHDYGLVVPAFQEPLGISLTQQESWVMAHVELLSNYRVGVYGVDNADPNRIYPFTVYPQVRGLLRYFVAASRQWQDVRVRYMMSRKDAECA
jgi:hypothetical protein